MKKKMIFGCFALALLIINISLSFQSNQNGYALDELLNVTNARSEFPFGWDFEPDYQAYDASCNECYCYGYPIGCMQSTCDCTQFVTYCHEGSQLCTPETTYQIYGDTCVPWGSSC